MFYNILKMLYIYFLVVKFKKYYMSDDDEMINVGRMVY